jgi:hypothetical protein
MQTSIVAVRDEKNKRQLYSDENLRHMIPKGKEVKLLTTV